MIRALTILAAVAALAVSAAPASAGTSKARVPRPSVAGFFLDIGTAEKLDMNAWVWHEAARNGIAGKRKHGAVLYNGHAGLGANTKPPRPMALRRR